MEENTQFTSPLRTRGRLEFTFKKKKKLDKSRMQTVRFGAAPVRVFVSSLTANSSGTEPDGTLDLFESAPTSPTQTHSSEQQIQSKARAETTCKRQRKEGDAGGGGKERRREGVRGALAMCWTSFVSENKASSVADYCSRRSTGKERQKNK